MLIAQRRAAKAKAGIHAQIAALEATRQAAQQEWDRRKSAAQDLTTGASEIRTDLRQAHEKAAAEFT